MRFSVVCVALVFLGAVAWGQDEEPDITSALLEVGSRDAAAIAIIFFTSCFKLCRLRSHFLLSFFHLSDLWWMTFEQASEGKKFF